MSQTRYIENVLAPLHSCDPKENRCHPYIFERIKISQEGPECVLGCNDIGIQNKYVI